MGKGITFNNIDAVVDRKAKEIKEKRKQTILEMITGHIQHENESVNHYWGLIGTAEALGLDGSDMIRSVVEDIIRDENKHIDKLLTLRQKLI